MSEITGNIKEKFVTYEEILRNSNGGYDIYHYYFGSVPKKCHSPFRRDENASFGFFHYNGIWLWKDISLDESGGPIEFVMRKFSLNYKDSIHKICWDFGWKGGKEELGSEVVTWKPPIIREDYVHISFSTCLFDEKHHKYWNDYHLSEEYLRKYDVYRVKDLAIRRKKVTLKEHELTYVYWDRKIDKCKILRIGVGKDNKWRSNVPFNHLWWLDKKEECDKLLICKSNKDALVLSLFNVCVTATQSENASCISEENIRKINNIAEHPYIVFGADEQGLSQSSIISKKLKGIEFHTPIELVKEGINDPAEYCKKFGLEKMEELLKKNRIL